MPSEFFCDKQPNLYFIHDDCGQRGIIKKIDGYRIDQGISQLTSHIEQAEYKEKRVALKFLQPTAYFGDEYLQRRSCLRAVFCNHLLGRESFTFRLNDSQCLVTEWVDGVNLSYMTNHNIQEVDIKLRIQMAYDVTSQLHRLHCAGIIHHDVKASNVMISVTKNQIYLLDFDGANLPNEAPRPPMPIWFSKHFVDTVILHTDLTDKERLKDCFNYQSDIYGLAFVFAALFPELFCVERKEIVLWAYNIQYVFPMEIVLSKTSNNVHALAVLIQIVEKMCVQDRSQRYQHLGKILVDLNILCHDHGIQLPKDVQNLVLQTPEERIGHDAFAAIDGQSVSACYSLEQEFRMTH